MKQTPDTTSQLLRSLLEASQPAPRSALRFLWPSPPYYEAIDAGDQPSEACLLIFKDGTRATGTLLNFLPDDALLKFRQSDENSSVSIGFAELLWMQLLGPVGLRREARSLGAAQEQSFAPSDHQPFSVPLIDGQTFQGETIGYVHALCGMFLYLPEKENTIIRCFVPAQSAQTANIGKPIGQMLVDQNLALAEAVSAALEKQLAMRTRRLGEYLTENQIVSQEQLAAALKQQRAQPVQKLGETLVELGYLTQPELDEALAMEARNRSVPLGQILADMGVVDAEVIQGLMAKKLGIPFVNLRSLKISPNVLKRIPAAMAYRYNVIPVAEAENALVIAVDNPMQMGKMEELRFIAGSKLVPVMASTEDIRFALERSYGPERDTAGAAARAGLDVGIGELATRLAAESGEVELNEQYATRSDTTLVKLVNRIILDAAQQKASDIHIEANPTGKSLRIRFRKDSSLVTYLEMPGAFRKALISRIKIMSGRGQAAEKMAQSRQGRAVSPEGLRGLRQDRLQGKDGGVRVAGRGPRRKAPDPDARADHRDCRRGDGHRHAHSEAGRHRESAARPDRPLASPGALGRYLTEACGPEFNRRAARPRPAPRLRTG
jgi:hypothetical protein